MDVATMKKDLENQIGDISKELENIYLPHDAVLILLGKRTAFRIALETLIPELKESEDEKARKWLTNLVENLGNAADEDAEKELEIMRPLALAYLEKQKDHFRDDTKMVEQKPAEWSEEDSKRYVSIRTTLETSAVLSKEDYDANVVWLRELVNAKKYSSPKQNWSEEDKNIIDTIVSVLGQYIDYKAVSGTGSGYATPRYSKEIAWLKSLRPSWKPSEEQMKEYSYWYRNFIESGLASPTSKAVTVLGELLEQLKKLM